MGKRERAELTGYITSLVLTIQRVETWCPVKITCIAKLWPQFFGAGGCAPFKDGTARSLYSGAPKMFISISTIPEFSSSVNEGTSELIDSVFAGLEWLVGHADPFLFLKV